jgi:hypothetical protein
MFGTKLEVKKYTYSLIFSNVMAALALLYEEQFRTLFKRWDIPNETAEMGFPTVTAHYNRADRVRDLFEVLQNNVVTHITVLIHGLGF